jgi:hypothetical protein
MSIFMLIAAMAFGSDLPEKPEASKPVPGQCARAIPVKPQFVADCKGVLLPTSWMADYEHLSVWADQIANQYKLDKKLHELQIKQLKKELEAAKKPKPFFERPVFWSTAGIIFGGAIVVAGGYAVGQAGG